MCTVDKVDEEAAARLLALQSVDVRANAANDALPDSRAQSNALTSNEATDGVPPTSTQTTPVREFRLAGLKRGRDDSFTIIYASGPDRIGVPYAKGDSADTLFMRRNAAARRLFNMNRDQVFCSWRSSVVSLISQGYPWILFRDSPAQKRYRYNNTIQLVITRYTCSQWRAAAALGGDSDATGSRRPTGTLCRSCSNKNWRAACANPIFIKHVMPLPGCPYEACEECLQAFAPTPVQCDTTLWTRRLPQIIVR